MAKRNKLTQKALSGITLSQDNPLHDQFKNHHLRIENALEQLIVSRFQDPDAFDLERLSFPSKVQLARALVGKQPDDDLWEIPLQFNSVRNSMVHFKNLAEVTSRLKKLRLKVKRTLTAQNLTFDVSKDETLMIAAVRIALSYVEDIRTSL